MAHLLYSSDTMLTIQVVDSVAHVREDQRRTLASPGVTTTVGVERSLGAGDLGRETGEVVGTEEVPRTETGLAGGAEKGDQRDGGAGVGREREKVRWL